MKICILVICIISLTCSVCFGENDISALLQKGKNAIENGKYEDAVNRLGEIMTASGNQTNDPKIVAFGSTVQAYGIWKMNNPQMTPMVIQYLDKAIAADSNWQYPQKLLKEVQSNR